MKPCLLFLSCKNIEEADKISRRLLEKKLIVCAKANSVSSMYLWKDKIESDSEILLIMDSVEENFNRINKEVGKLHSYEVYNLLMVKVDKINRESLNWIKKSVGERT